MIRTILRIQWINLKRDYIALGLTFVMPIIFFTIFAWIFGNMGSGGGSMNKIRVAVVDLDKSEASERFLAALGDDEGGLRLQYHPKDKQDQPYTRESALKLVQDGNLPAAVVIPEGFGETFGIFGGEAKAVEVLYDQANPVASQMVVGLMQKAAMTAAPDLLMSRGLEMLEESSEPLSDSQRAAADFAMKSLREQAESDEESGEAESSAGGLGAGVVQVDAKSVVRAGDDGESKTVIAFYAAGTGVMFLLFSMAGAAGKLLEEEESGALDRLMTSNIGMGRLLFGKWLFIGLGGVLQVCLMFVWGAFVFGVELFTPNHLAGFITMTLFTAAAAAAFGLVLATACRSRAQLDGVSTLVILIMSAVGGSMFPRFMMPDLLRKAGLLTFNGWALDGYLKVFWYEDPDASVLGSVIRLWPQLLVLLLLTVLFLAIARQLARRWETI